MMTEYKKEPNHVPCLLRKINLFEQPTYVGNVHTLSFDHPPPLSRLLRPTDQPSDRQPQPPPTCSVEQQLLAGHERIKVLPATCIVFSCETHLMPPCRFVSSI